MTVNVWEASDDWEAWIGDCGPYVGPWPPAPPIPANLPPITDCDELDYVISGDGLAAVVDSSFDGLDIWRFYRFDGTTGTRSGIGQPLVTGNLYVAFYGPDSDWPTPEPSMLPLELVPSLYVSGGTGSPVPDPAGGQWSDTQPTSTTAGFASPVDYQGQYRSATIPDGQHHDGVGQTPGDVDARGKTDELIDDMAATWPLASGSSWASTFGFTLPGSEMFFNADKDFNPTLEDPTPHLYHTVAVSNRQSAARYTVATPSLPFPAALDDLIEGLDYTAPPTLDVGDTDVGGAVYSAAPTFAGWNDCPVTVAFTISNQGDPTLYPADEVPTVYGRLRIGAVDPSDVTAGPPFSYSDGDEMLEIDSTTPGTSSQSATLPLSAIAGDTFGLIAMSGFLDTDPAPISDFAAPVTTGNGFLLVWQVLIHVGGSISARFDVPGWRYWIPGGLAWRPFIAGAFETGSGATLYINTPGLGLVPVMDGPG